MSKSMDPVRHNSETNKTMNYERVYAYYQRRRGCCCH